MAVSLPLPAIERLFARHRLTDAAGVQHLQGGRLNASYRVGKSYVLRCRSASNATGSLQREAALMPRVRARIAAPEALAAGMDDLLGEYIIQRWIPGRDLLAAWADNPDVSTREWWLVQWAHALRAVHEERFPRPGELPHGDLREYPTWRIYIETRIRKRIDSLMRIPGVDRGLLLAAERYMRRHAPVLEDGPFCLIHRDCHFGNVLVDGPTLAGVLDFELAESGTPDYELDAIYRFLRYPWLYSGARKGLSLTPARFASVWVRLRRHYPELFAVPYLRRRISLYALDHDLSCLLQALQNRTPMLFTESNEQAMLHTLERLAEVLDDRYGPE